MCVRASMPPVHAQSEAAGVSQPPMGNLLPIERDFLTVYDEVAHQDFIDANHIVFPMEWKGARRFVAVLITFYQAADQTDTATKNFLMYELYRAFTEEMAFVDAGDINQKFEPAHNLKVRIINGFYTAVADWSPMVENLHDDFFNYNEAVYKQVQRAYTCAAQPCTDYSSEYFLRQMKLNYVINTDYFDAMERFKHSMSAAAIVLKQAPKYMRFACLSSIAHNILSTMYGQPGDFINNCFGEQFAIAKKLGKTWKATEVRNHAHYMQNIVSKFAISDFNTYMADHMATFQHYKRAATRAPYAA
eukprot:6212902-Pleurochrysis_carterae.AAC.1